MTDPNLDTGSPAGGPPAVDTGSPNGGGTGGNPNPQTPATGEPPAFAVPEAFKDRPWVGKVKSLDDVYKQLDNLDQLAGKKVITPIDYATATPEQIAEHHAKLAPQEIKAYGFGKPDDPVAMAVGDAFKKGGINEHQGKAIVEALTPFFDKMELDLKESNTSEEGYMKLAQTAFGENFKTNLGRAEKILKTHIAEDAEAVKAFDDMPNDQRIAVDKAINKIADAYEGRIAAILKEHGIHETGAQTEGGQGNAASDVNELRKSLRAEIREMDKRPHTAQEKQNKIDALNKTYQK